MEQGFYHPARGYWQTNTEVSAEIRASYPEGTVEVPLKPAPNYEWLNNQWVYVAPDPNLARQTMTLSFSQLLIGLVSEGWITAAEGRAWRDRVSLPPAITSLIESLPEQQQFVAETRAMAFTEAYRLDPLVEALGAAENKTPEELDQFFITYQGV
jgi:hypothetical protein